MSGHDIGGLLPEEPRPDGVQGVFAVPLRIAVRPIAHLDRMDSVLTGSQSGQVLR